MATGDGKSVGRACFGCLAFTGCALRDDRLWLSALTGCLSVRPSVRPPVRSRPSVRPLRSAPLRPSVEVYTIFENSGSVCYSRNWKPWKCILFSKLETLDVYYGEGEGEEGEMNNIF